MEMHATLVYPVNGISVHEDITTEIDEQSFWRCVAQRLFEVDVPGNMDIISNSGSARLSITERGTYRKAGVDVPSMFVLPEFNEVDLPRSTYEDAYLTCVNPDSKGGMGNYKFYRLSQLPDGNVTAYYGRIGQRSGFGSEREIKEPMPSWMFEVRKAEKISKGYIDRSDVYLAGDPHEYLQDGRHRHAGSGNLYAKLLSYAKGFLTQSLVQGTHVTNEQVEQSKALVNRMCRCRKVESFNSRLEELLAVAPRNVSSVRSQLARSSADFARILDREQSIVAAMTAVVASRDAEPKTVKDGFATDGIAWHEASADERAEAERCLPSSLKAKVRNVYRIEPSGQKRRFESYLAAHGLDEDDVRLMWHGSRNANWCSIVSKSLLLNPDAVITGKMFGYGIYFGYDEAGCGALKSWNYTSARGSYWAGGASDTAFMGLFECAYGRPLHPRSVHSFRKDELDAAGCNCVHVYGGDCGLQHDEVVFYDESAVCIRYLVEFAA